MSEKRLYAIVLELAAMNPGALPANHGDQARAALLALIKKGDSPLAQQLHDSNEAKPYAISLIKGGKWNKREYTHNFGEGDRAEWRFSLMMEAAFEALLQKYLLNNALPHVRIGHIHFAIVGVFVSHESHPDSGHISVAELTQGWKQHQAEYPRRIVFDFQSPTAFSLGRNTDTGKYRFRSNPDARTIFSSLRKTWVKKLGGYDAGDEFDEWVGENIETEIIYLRTQKLRVEKRTVTGFIGEVAFQHYGDDIRFLPYFNLLSDLTFWTGTGYQTTRGMGQVRRQRHGSH